jgi:hypothetical protein
VPLDGTHTLVVGSSNGSLRKLQFDTSNLSCQVTSAFVFSLMSVDLYGQDARCLDVVHKLEGYIHALTFNQRRGGINWQLAMGTCASLP